MTTWDLRVNWRRSLLSSALENIFRKWLGTTSPMLMVLDDGWREWMLRQRPSTMVLLDAEIVLYMVSLVAGVAAAAPRPIARMILRHRTVGGQAL